jgi:hypothetical protein
MLLFVALQKYHIAGIMLGGMKGWHPGVKAFVF